MSNPQCKAVAAAMQKSGLSEDQVAERIPGTSKQRVVDIITGTKKPTADEFKALASALNITSPLPKDSAHTA